MARTRYPGEEWTTVEWVWNWAFPFLHRIETRHKMVTVTFADMLEAWKKS